MNRKYVIWILIVLIILTVTALPGVIAQEETPRQRPPGSFLGVTFMPVDSGALVITHVMAGSPAEEAGLMANDIITAINGETVDSANLPEIVHSYAPDDTITITVARGEETLDIAVTLGECLFPALGPRVHVSFDNRPFLGVRVEVGEDGIEILEVLPDSPAETAGLMNGDIIVTVNGEEIADIANLRDIIRDVVEEEGIVLGVERGGEPLEIEITLDVFPAPGWPGVIIRDHFGRMRAGDIRFLPDEGVWEVTELDEDGLLADAGLQPGDRITAINGNALGARGLPGLPHEFRFDFGRSGTITLTIERDGEILDLEVPAEILTELVLDVVMPLERFEEVPGRMGELWQILPHSERSFQILGPNRVWLGVQYLMLDEQSAEARAISVTEGALLIEVDLFSPADVAGLQTGDIIQTVNDEVVDPDHILTARLNAYEPGDTVTLGILRAGEALQIDVTLEQLPHTG